MNQQSKTDEGSVSTAILKELQELERRRNQLLQEQSEVRRRQHLALKKAKASAFHALSYRNALCQDLVPGCKVAVVTTPNRKVKVITGTYLGYRVSPSGQLVKLVVGVQKKKKSHREPNSLYSGGYTQYKEVTYNGKLSVGLDRVIKI